MLGASAHFEEEEKEVELMQPRMMKMLKRSVVVVVVPRQLLVPGQSGSSFCGFGGDTLSCGRVCFRDRCPRVGASEWLVVVVADDDDDEAEMEFAELLLFDGG